jgi:hypothetical protein
VRGEKIAAAADRQLMAPEGENPEPIAGQATPIVDKEIERASREQRRRLAQACRHMTDCLYAGGHAVCPDCVTAEEFEEMPKPPLACAAERAAHQVDEEMHQRDADIIEGRRKGKFDGFTQAERALISDGIMAVKDWFDAVPNSRAAKNATEKLVDLIESGVKLIGPQ